MCVNVEFLQQKSYALPRIVKDSSESSETASCESQESNDLKMEKSDVSTTELVNPEGKSAPPNDGNCRKMEFEFDMDAEASRKSEMKRENTVKCFLELAHHLQENMGNEKHIDKVLDTRGLGKLVVDIWDEIKKAGKCLRRKTLKETQRSVAFYLYSGVNQVTQVENSQESSRQTQEAQTPSQPLVTTFNRDKNVCAVECSLSIPTSNYLGSQKNLISSSDTLPSQLWSDSSSHTKHQKFKATTKSINCFPENELLNKPFHIWKIISNSALLPFPYIPNCLTK